MTAQPTNGWFEKHVVESLDDLKSDVKALTAKIDPLTERVTRVEEQGKVRSTLFGALSGALIVLMDSFRRA